MSKRVALESAIREIRAHAGANRVIRVQPYTFARWADATGIPGLEDLAKKNRVMRIQPYTFSAWLALAEERRR